MHFVLIGSTMPMEKIKKKRKRIREKKMPINEYIFHCVITIISTNFDYVSLSWFTEMLKCWTTSNTIVWKMGYGTWHMNMELLAKLEHLIKKRERKSRRSKTCEREKGQIIRKTMIRKYWERNDFTISCNFIIHNS